MTTLASGANITLALSDYDSVTVSTQGVVLVEAVSGLGVDAGRVAVHTGTRTFGPYVAAGSLKLTAQGSSAQYEIADGAAPSIPGGGGGGAAIDTLPSALSVDTDDTIAVTRNGVASQVSTANFLASLGVEDSALPAAGAMNGADIITLSQSGVVVRSTLAALATFLGGGLPAVPGAVTSLAAGTPTTSTIPLTWVNAATATAWVVKQRLAGSGSYVNSAYSVAATATGATINGLTAGTAYDLQVVASNAGGDGPVATILAVSTAAGAAVATGVTMTGPTGGTVSVASTDFSVGVTPVGGTIAGTVTVTPSDAGGGGTFTPTSVTLTTASPAATFAYTPSATAGARTISVTNNGSLANPASITYTSTAAAAQATITPNTAAAIPYTSISASTRTTDYTTALRFAHDKLAASRYWLISTNPVSAEAGWGLSNVTPPASVSLAQNNTSGASSINGLVPMDKPAAYGFQGTLMAPPGASGPWFPWIKPLGEAAQCVGAGLMITA